MYVDFTDAEILLAELVVSRYLGKSKSYFKPVPNDAKQKAILLLESDAPFNKNYALVKEDNEGVRSYSLYSGFTNEQVLVSVTVVRYYVDCKKNILGILRSFNNRYCFDKLNDFNDYIDNLIDHSGNAKESVLLDIEKI